MIILKNMDNNEAKEIHISQLYDLIKETTGSHIIITWLPSIAKIEFSTGLPFEKRWFKVIFMHDNSAVMFEEDVPIESILEAFVTETEN